MRARRARIVVAAIVAAWVAFVTVAPMTSSAATLGGLRSATLATQAYAGAGTFDSFDYPVGTELANVTDKCGNQWQVRGGVFTITSAGTAISGTSNALVTATVPVCGESGDGMDVSVDMLSVGSSLFGLLLHADVGGRPATMVTYTNAGSGTVQLWKVRPDGTRTELAVTKQTGGGNMNRTLRTSYHGGVYQVFLNERLVMSYTVPPAERPALEARTQVGLAAAGDTRSTFDNFQAWPR